MNSEIVHIIIPVYNAEKYLDRCLESCLNQTYKNIDIICVNDGSTDSSFQIMEEYSKKFRNLRIFSKENTGVSDTRNFAIDKCTNDGYIIFVDSDDYIEDFYLQKMMDVVQKNDSDFFCYCYENFVANKENMIISQLNWTSSLGPTRKVIRTEIVKNVKFNSSLKCYEDSLFNIECILLANSFSNFYTTDLSMGYNVTKNTSSLTRSKISNDRIFYSLFSWYLVYTKLSKNDFLKNNEIKICAINKLASEYLEFFANYNFKDSANKKDITNIQSIIFKDKIIKNYKSNNKREKMKRKLFLFSSHLYRFVSKVF